MASRSLFFFFFFLLLSFSPLLISVTGEEDLVRPIDRKLLGLKKQKLSHFRLYWHDILSGPNRTNVRLISSPTNSSTLFGMVNMIDNPMTVGPELSSKLVGRAQGFYAGASQNDVAILMAMNFAFVEGKYNGSTITVLGRNPVLNKVREMPVIGGSGVFRFARGYVEARTHWISADSLEATVEYNVYVMHY